MKRFIFLVFCLAFSAHAEYPIERVGGSHAVITTHTMTRLTDSAKQLELFKPAYIQTGGPYPGRGLTNGYSKFSNESPDGKYFLGFSTQGSELGLYRADGTFMRRLTHKLPDGRIAGLGEFYDVRWANASSLIYHSGPVLYWQDAATGTELPVYTFNSNIIAENHADQTAKYRLVKLASKDVYLVDLKELTAKKMPWTSGSSMDISPDDEWVYRDASPYDAVGPQFWGIPELLAGNALPVTVPCNSVGHDGFSFNAKGQSVYVFFNNRDDFITFFDPHTSETIKTLNMKETGYSPAPGFHFGRIQNPEIRGWTLVSSYGGAGWINDQLFLLHTSGKIIRLGASACTYRFPLASTVTDVKTARYFAENFAGISPDGQRVYVGGNGQGTENLNVWRLTLPDKWWNPPTLEQRVADLENRVLKLESKP